MKKKTLVRALSAIGLTTMLAACGGGASSSAPVGSGPAPVATGTLSMAVTDGPSDTFNHVWVTIKAMSIHTSPDAIWNPADASWTTMTLAAPITIDLAQLNNGAIDQVFSGMTLPVGTYRQIRFFFASADDNLTSSAQAITDNQSTPSALQWNDQVEYADPTSGVISEAPLEIAYPTQGIQLVGNFNVTENSEIKLVTDFDLAKIIAPYHHDSGIVFTMRPVLHYFDVSQSGAIQGQIDPTTLCQSSIAGNCAYNVIVHAEVMSADGSRHVAKRSTKVDPVTGNFMLYPVDTKDAAGNALSYDLVIRGRNMETMLVTGITPAGNASSGATVVQSSAITPTINTNEYGAQFASPLQPLSNGHVVFQQTIPVAGVTSPVPYEIRWDATDPYTGKLYAPYMLATAAVHVASFNAGDALSFSNVTPSEGLGGYSVATNEIAYYDLSSMLAIQAPNVGNLLSFTPPTPTIKAGIDSGTVSGNIAIANAAAFDHATLVIARFGNIITTQDVSSLIGNGGAFTVTGIPAGNVSNKLPGAYYYGYLRLWKTGAHKRAKIVTVPGAIDLRNSNTVDGFNVSVSGS